MSFRRNSLGGKKKKEGIPWQSSDLDSVLTTKAVQSWVRELQTPVCVVWQKKKKKTLENIYLKKGTIINSGKMNVRRRGNFCQ